MLVFLLAACEAKNGELVPQSDPSPSITTTPNSALREAAVDEWLKGYWRALREVVDGDTHSADMDQLYRFKDKRWGHYEKNSTPETSRWIEGDYRVHEGKFVLYEGENEYLVYLFTQNDNPESSSKIDTFILSQDDHKRATWFIRLHDWQADMIINSPRVEGELGFPTLLGN